MQEIILEDDHILLEDERVSYEAPEKAMNFFHSKPKEQSLFAKLEEFSLSIIPIALVLGPIGSGKSFWLKAFQNQHVGHCQLIQGFSRLDFRSIFQKGPFCEHGALVEGNSIDDFLQAVKSAKQPFTLIIDDADFVSLETLQLLIDGFAHYRFDGIKLILAGDAILQKRVENFCKVNSPAENVVYTIQPLAIEETEAYLRTDFCSEQNLSPTSFSKKDIETIHKLSEGYVGRIKRVALHVANQNKAEEASKPRKSKKTYVDRILSLAILVLLIILGVHLYQQMDFMHSQTTIASSPKVPNHVQPLVSHADVYFEEENTPSFVASIEQASIELILPEPSPVAYMQAGLAARSNREK